MQACVQCGLSIGELATFCPVCGTPVGDGVAVTTAAESGAPFGPALDPYAGGLEPEAPEPGTQTQPGQEPAAGLVTELESDRRHVPGADPDADAEAGPDADSEAVHLDASPVTGHSSILDAEPDAGGTELVADLAAEHTAEAEAAAEAHAEAQAEAAAEPEPEAPRIREP